MPIIKKPETPKVDKQFRIRMSEDIFQEIEAYCAWAELPSKDYFVEQASLIALRRDKEWRSKKNKIETENLISYFDKMVYMQTKNMPQAM